MKESTIYEQISQYLQLQYPGVIYRFDSAADMKMTIGQAAKNKRRNPHRGYPDLFIAEPHGDYHGLYIEIKKEGQDPYRKDGKLKSDEHIQEQAEMLRKLSDKGYAATFAVGFEGVKEVIDTYMHQ